MPLREAMRTSILSRRWRYMWTTLKELVFDDRCIPSPSRHKSVTDRLVEIVDTILLLHWGSIKKFVLTHEEFESTNDIDCWILYLSRFSVTDLSLSFEEYEHICKIWFRWISRIVH
ncbi:hypothetical protein CDL15_Pgr006842 [Punica granatum]|uniref:F-box domain-containing protein n=1 Tax=Punica granatum TaxID=22663 RepID=A0A218X8V2_PUNGR|nr:hypothetical protein CDL15_Pgr006842 [Punica granatum]